jgi:hypothetical protein
MRHSRHLARLAAGRHDVFERTLRDLAMNH